jgi:hypothetical protein
MGIYSYINVGVAAGVTIPANGVQLISVRLSSIRSAGARKIIMEVK